MSRSVCGALAVVLVVASCGGQGGASPEVETAAATASPTAGAPLGAEGLEEAACSAVGELLIAAGNPDTGERSAAWSAFEEAMLRGDPTEIQATTAVVLDHLDAARTDAARIARYPDGGDASDHLVALFTGLAEGVTQVRDGTLEADDEAVSHGRDAIQAAYQDHFWQGLRPLSELFAAAGIDTPMPCPADAPPTPEPAPETGRHVTITELAAETDPLGAHRGEDLLADAVIGSPGAMDPCPMYLEPSWFDYCEGGMVMLSDPEPTSRLPEVILAITSEELPPSVFAVIHPDAVDLREDPLDDLVTVTAHYDDPAALECRHTEWPEQYGPPRPPEEVVMMCRLTLVITEIVPYAP
jgi:hypothetical protein